MKSMQRVICVERVTGVYAELRYQMVRSKAPTPASGPLYCSAGKGYF